MVVYTVDVLVSLEQEVAIPLSVDLVILSGTAMEGHGMAYCVTPKNILTHIMFHSDFNVTSSSRLTFNRKQNQSYTVFVADDDETEEKESFTLSLTSPHPTDSVVISSDIFTITITDNDSKPITIHFTINTNIASLQCGTHSALYITHFSCTCSCTKWLCIVQLPAASSTGVSVGHCRSHHGSGGGLLFLQKKKN